jgi:outer membrane receptor protein involved in Fe transport
MNGMMDDLGVHFDNERVSIGADRTEYKPEEAWNFELGASFHKGGFRADVNAFYITALRQQLTVFPPGMSTGRMMTNAGKSRSYGVEAQVSYNKGGFAAHAAWGWNNACFTEYTDGTVSYAGNRIPYSPEHTLFAALGYNWSKVSLQAHMRGIGPIAWNEQNTLVEPFYVTLGARASVELGRVLLYLEGENLTNTRYKAFYFKSMGNEFFQPGKPISLQLGIQIRII